MTYAYLFDLDGTLIDSEAIWTEAIQYALSLRGVQLTFQQVFELECGRAWHDIFDEIKTRWPHAFATIADMQAITTDFYERVCQTRDIAIHPSIRCLKQLADDGAPVCIVTGSVRARVEQVAHDYGFADRLAAIVSCEDYQRGKPDPQCYLLAASILGVPPQNCIVFEDALPGIRAAQRAGMACVALTRTTEQRLALADAHPTLILDSLDDFSPALLPGPHHVAIALGANLGDAEHTFAQACQLLEQAGLQNLRRSPSLITAPVDCVPNTPDFHNAALTGDWDGTPLQLLDATQAIERHLGRPAQHSQHESRTIDLDLLLVDGLAFTHPRLTIPHPRLRQRRFALQPLALLEPDWPLPSDGLTVRLALELLPPTPQHA